MTLYGDRIVLEEGDWETEDTLSAREYVHYEVMAAEVEAPGYPYRSEKRAVTLTVYVDTETGLLVGDIPSFEKWMEGK